MPRQGLGGAAAASAPVMSWQALSPVGAQKLPPQTLKQHSTTFPRVTKITLSVAQGRRLVPGKAQALWMRQAGFRGLGRASPARTPSAPRPSPWGQATCFPRTEGEARNGNSWRELKADILKLRVFCFFWRDKGPAYTKGWATH